MSIFKYNPSINSSYMYLLFPIIIIFGFLQSYICALPMMTIWMIYGVIPMLDKIFSQDWQNPTLK